MTRSPKEVVQALVEAYNAKSLEGVLELYADDAVFWDPLHRDGVRGRGAIAGVVQELFDRFPDERMSICTLAGDEAAAVAELRSEGTLEGSPFSLDLTEVYEVSGGRITSCRVYLDPEELPGAGTRRAEISASSDVSARSEGG